MVLIRIMRKWQVACYVLVFVYALSYSADLKADTKQCPKCNGSGWQVTFPNVSHYGVEKTKRKCPVCGEMVFSGHRDRCTMCGGQGHIDDGRRRSNDDYGDNRAAEGEVFFVQHLTPSENQLRQALMQSLLATKYVVDTCSVCRGSTFCKQCGGVQNLSIDVDVTTLCRVCGGSGKCIACRGQGTMGGRIEQANSPAEKEKIARNIKVFSEIANLRYSLGISPSNPNGPSIGMDGDGNYYIKNGSDQAEGLGYSNDNGLDSHSGTGSNTVVILAIVAVVVVAFFFVRRKMRK